MDFLQVACVAEKQASENKLAEMKASLNGFFLSAIVGARDWISVAPSTNEGELMIRDLHKAMLIIFFEIEWTCFQNSSK